MLSLAAKKATNGLDDLGIPFEEPKIGRVRRFKNLEDMQGIGGTAMNARDFSLHTHVEPCHKPRKVRNAAQLSGVIVHEVVHCARMEHVGRLDFVELVATEGLAYIAQHLYEQKFCGKQVLSKFWHEEDLNIDQQLDTTFREFVSEDRFSEEDKEEWSFSRGYSSIPHGALYGAQRVWKRLSAGAELAELVSLPAEVILDLKK